MTAETRYTAYDYEQADILDVRTEFGAEAFFEICEAFQMPICVLQVRARTVAHLTARVLMNLALRDAQGTQEDIMAIQYWDTIPPHKRFIAGWYMQAYAACGDLAALLFISQMRNHKDVDIVGLANYSGMVQKTLDARLQDALAGLRLNVRNGLMLHSSFDDNMSPDTAKAIIMLAIVGDHDVHQWIKSLITVDEY